MYIKIGQKWYNPETIEYISNPFYLVKSEGGYDIEKRGDKWHAWVKFNFREQADDIMFEDRREAEIVFNLITGSGCIDTQKLFDKLDPIKEIISPIEWRSDSKEELW